MSEDLIKKVFDSYMDAGWKSFVAERQKDIKRTNYRLLVVISKLKGEEFTGKLKAAMKDFLPKGFHPRLSIVREIKGMQMNTKQGLPITIFQFSTDVGVEGNVYVEIKKGRWVMFKY